MTDFTLALVHDDWPDADRAPSFAERVERVRRRDITEFFQRGADECGGELP